MVQDHSKLLKVAWGWGGGRTNLVPSYVEPSPQLIQLNLKSQPRHHKLSE